ncbi:MAG: TonB family protein [Undibacterium sp.]|nr:TonB family protein [Opitutaceae bacterium]
MLSITLHGGAVALMLFFTYAVSQRSKDVPKVFELVAGAGDNYMATEAPALGTPGGVKLNLPNPPVPIPQIAAPEPVQETPPATVTPEPSSITPAPAEKPAPPVKTPVKPAEPAPQNFKNQIVKKIIRAESQAKREIKKEQEKAAKISKDAFDKANKAKTAAAAATAKNGGPTKVAKIDAEGIAAGVVGGSTKNKKDGAGGKALVVEDGSQMERYFALLKSRLKENHEKPAGLSDTLVARVEFYVGADGSISRVKISRSSGSAEFDRSVVEAFSRTKSIGARPDKKGEAIELEFKMREEDGE